MSITFGMARDLYGSYGPPIGNDLTTCEPKLPYNFFLNSWTNTAIVATMEFRSEIYYNQVLCRITK